ncbi:hypothetical protein D5E76_25395 [Vibrio parahaemolyticus]|nr:hypothetical protein D5E76_25395 [Vibrio parahaemolyticus]
MLSVSIRLIVISISISTKAHNAALRGEQRRPPNLNHCAVITEAELNPKYRALGIPLERFVM